MDFKKSIKYKIFAKDLGNMTKTNIDKKGICNRNEARMIECLFAIDRKHDREPDIARVTNGRIHA